MNGRYSKLPPIGGNNSGPASRTGGAGPTGPTKKQLDEMIKHLRSEHHKHIGEIDKLAIPLPEKRTMIEVALHQLNYQIQHADSLYADYIKGQVGPPSPKWKQ